jgi:predicted DNA-binding protein (UPF0251 family)
MSDSDPWAPGDSEDATSERVQDGTQGARVARAGTPKKRENRGRYRQRALKRPGTSSTSPKQIEMAKRRTEALDLRVQSYSYEEIAEHLGVTKSTIERDIQRALKELVVEPAHAVFALEMRRIDALISTYMADALNGDANSAGVVLKFMAHRANLLGWGSKEHVARLTVTDAPGSAEPRALVEFVMPGNRIIDMEKLDELPPPRSSLSSPSSPRPTQQPSRDVEQSIPFTVDVVVNKPNSGVPFIKPRKPTDWMS